VAAGAALAGGSVLRGEEGGAAAAAGLGPIDPAVKSPTDRVSLGKSGLKVSLVGIGTGSIGHAGRSNQTRLGQPAFTKLMRHALDRGVNFFDLADSYGTHPYFREAMRGVERTRYVVQTKTGSRDAREAAADVERFLRELGTDYLDSLIIHCVTEPDWTTRYRGVMDVLSEARRQGKVRAVGVTCHSFEALEAAAASRWVELNQVRWNPRAAHMDAGVDKARALFRGMRGRGQGMVGMKVVGQGDIVRGRPALTPAECFRFQIESGVVDAFVVGCESTEQIDELLGGTQLALNELGYRAAPSA
ncbi:MAG TPA: aldo/keto reductase, partial [Pyrinomonadaceae bacterium]